jgi:hypothetical protein
MSLSIGIVIDRTLSRSGYPQGKNLSPATMRASMRKATNNLPCIQAFAPSISVFFKWPNAKIDSSLDFHG